MRAFAQSCHELGIPIALEVSRSGKGAHAWVFFADSVSARDARRLGTAIISHTCARTRQLKLTSYDRLFPNQDTMPIGGFGNLIALPLQKKPRENGGNVFVDTALRPYPDQWAFLASIKPMLPHDIEPTILRATNGVHPLDVTFIHEEDNKEPWKRRATVSKKLPGPMQQYAGRLHRTHTTKTDARIIDFVDTSHPALFRMWEKRQRGYREMGYRVAAQSTPNRQISEILIAT